MDPLSYAEASNDNPPPPPRTPPPSNDTSGVVPGAGVNEARTRTPPARAAAIPVARRPRGQTCDVLCPLITFIVILGAYAAIVYGYAMAEAYPLPYGALTSNYREYGAFLALMWIFGTGTAFLIASIVAGMLGGGIESSSNCCAAFFCYIIVGAIVLATFFTVQLMGIIIAPGVQKKAFNHACDDAWLEIVMTGHTWKYSDSRNVAQVFLKETGELLFTYTSQDPHKRDFNFVGLNSTNPSVFPSIANVTINEETNRVIGHCYGTTPFDYCLTGYVWPYDGLQVEATVNGTTRWLRNRYDHWSFQNVPGVIMHDSDPAGNLGDVVLQTSIYNPESCSQMKMCVAKSAKSRGPEGVITPDIMIAAAWIIRKLAFYGVYCTAPSG